MAGKRQRADESSCEARGLGVEATGGQRSRTVPPCDCSPVAPGPADEPAQRGAGKAGAARVQTKQTVQAYLWPPSTGLPGLRCASRALAVVLIFRGRPAEGTVGFRALGELFAVAAVDMEGPAARGKAT
jgi:hypothetical protein